MREDYAVGRLDDGGGGEGTSFEGAVSRAVDGRGERAGVRAKDPKGMWHERRRWDISLRRNECWQVTRDFASRHR